MESQVTRHLFVYGSLRKGFHLTTYKYVSDFFGFVCTAKVRGIVSEIDGEFFATPCDENCFVKGELYKLNDGHNFSYVFGQLDDYEGLDVEQGEQPVYRRDVVTVYDENGISSAAWVYWFNGDVSGKPVITSGDVAEYPG